MKTKTNNNIKTKFNKKKLSNKELDKIIELSYNILKGNLSLTDKDLQNLQKHKNNLRNLVNKKISKNKKFRIVNKIGGFAQALLIPTISILSQLLLDQIKK